MFYFLVFFGREIELFPRAEDESRVSRGNPVDGKVALRYAGAIVAWGEDGCLLGVIAREIPRTAIVVHPG